MSLPAVGYSFEPRLEQDFQRNRMLNPFQCCDIVSMLCPWAYFTLVEMAHE